MRILLLTRYGRLGASSRMRSLQYLPWFERRGMECVVAPLFADEQLAERYRRNRYGFPSLAHSYWRRLLCLLQNRRFHLVWIEKEALPWFPAWFERFLLRGVPYVLDYDDAIFHNYDLHRLPLVRRLLGRRIDSLMAGARLVVAGNAYLAQRAREAGAAQVEIVPTVVDLERYPVKLPSRAGVGLLRVVWIGSPSTTRYLNLLREPLAELSRRFPLRLRVVGGAQLAMPGVDIEQLPWSEESEAALISDCDVGVMPLLDSPWERGKCGYKLIQYMACGLPVVASPVGANNQIVSTGENGYLADTEEAWLNSLALLLSDESLRHNLGAAGRRLVEQEYCIQRVAPRLAGLLAGAANAAR